jgi:hypothetical protein
MNHLLKLPTDILAFELLPFLSTKELGRLDIAVTNKLLRPQIFEAYQEARRKWSEQNSNGMVLQEIDPFKKNQISIICFA